MKAMPNEMKWPDAYGIYRCWWRGAWYDCYAYRRRGREDKDAPGVVMLVNTGEYYASGIHKYKQGEREAPSRFHKPSEVVVDKTVTTVIIPR
jgi:hypothetical protein